MSRRARPPTVRERIEDVRKRIPPPPQRRAKNPYISKDDFADLLEVSRSAVLNWTKSEGKPSYPQPAARDALARLSDGRYVPADFERPAEEQTGSPDRRIDRRVAALETAVERLERHIFGEDVAPSQ